MHKSKRSYKNLSIDTVAMCSVALLLLMVIMLIGKPITWTPMDIRLPVTHAHDHSDPTEEREATIYVGRDKLMYNIPDSATRKLTLQQMGAKYRIQFSPAEVSKFYRTGIIGTPVAGLKKYIDEYRNELSLSNQPGIPAGSANCELAWWIYESRRASITLYNRDLYVNIEADERTKFPQINYVFKVLGSSKIFRFGLLTNNERLLQ